MKRKVIICGIIIVILLMLGYIWWNMPVHFAKGINVAEVSQMEIIDENAERAVVLIPSEEMNHILDSVSGIEFKKSGISEGQMHYGFRITITGIDGKVMSKFIINSDSMIQKSPFFYEAQSPNICYDYIKKLF